MLDIQKGVIDSVSNGRAYVKLRGEDIPFPKGMKYPKSASPSAGDMVLVAKISGEYIITAVY